MSYIGWPERTDWSAAAQAAWTECRTKQLTAIATKQRADVERESQRVPDDPVRAEYEREAELAELPWLKRLWRSFTAAGRCNACHRKAASIEIPDWRAGYTTYRCRFCLSWDQTKIPTNSGGE